jgi:hypothetical protein
MIGINTIRVTALASQYNVYDFSFAIFSDCSHPVRFSLEWIPLQKRPFTSQSMASTSRRPQKTAETVDFVFSQIFLDKVPFCHKTFSLRMRFRFAKFLLDPTPVENFCVRWSKRIQIQRFVTRDSSGNLSTAFADFRIDKHAVSGKAQRSQVGVGKIDLGQLAKNGSGRVSIPVQSQILEGCLQFDVAVMAGDAPIAPSSDSGPVEPLQLPVVKPFFKSSWFSFKSTPDLVDQDAQALVEASTRR